MILIGITTGTSRDTEIPKINLNEQYIKYFRSLANTFKDKEIGFVFINHQTVKYNNITDLIQKLDGIVISGGISMHPLHYGENLQVSGEIDLLRDNFELELVRKAKEFSKPLFGICRGLQVILVEAGLPLCQSLSSEQTTINHWINDLSRYNYVHTVDAVNFKGNFLYKIGVADKKATSFFVNSIHDQGHIADAESTAIADRIGLKFNALSEDSVVEIASYQNLPIFGVQFHPEELYKVGDNVATKLGCYFLENVLKEKK